MNCTYTYKNKTYKGYKELIEELRKNKSDINDIIYSANLDLQTKNVDTLQNLKQSGFKVGQTQFRGEIKETDISSGSADLNIPSGAYSTQTFVDSGRFINPNGTDIIPVLRVDDYLKRQEQLYRSMGMQDSEIQSRLNLIQSNWKRIAQDGNDLHKIILHCNMDDDYQDVMKLTNGTSFFNISDTIHEKYENEIFKQVRLKNGKVSKEYGDNSENVILKNINVSAELTQGGTIYGHIDYAVVHPDGSIEIFNIKSSHEDPSYWDRAKIEKYQYEFALLAQILQYNGISAKNIKFNVIPIVLDYDEQFKNIKDITVKNSICYSHYQDSFILGKHMQQAGKFIPSNVNTVHIDQTSIDAVDKQLSAMFPIKNIKAVGIQATIKDYVDKNWYYWMRGSREGSGWNLTIDGEDIVLTDSRKGSENEELMDIIRKRADKLLDPLNGTLNASSIIAAFDGYRRIGFPDFKNTYLNSLFTPYFDHTTVTGVDGKLKFKYNWEIIKNDTLSACNILMFRNVNTNQVNVVSISGEDIDGKVEQEKSNTILGHYLSGSFAIDSEGHKLMDSTYGNIEIMRALTLLNELIPSLPDEAELGNITVIGGIGTKIKSKTVAVETVVPTFLKAQEVLNKKDPELKIENHFKERKNVSTVKSFLSEFWSIIEDVPNFGSTDLGGIQKLVEGTNPNGTYSEVGGLVLDSITSADTVEVQIQRLEELIKTVSSVLQGYTGNISPDKLVEQSQKSLNGSSNTEKLIIAGAKILVSASKALNQLSGIPQISASDLSEWERLIARPQNMSDNNIRIISTLLQEAINNVSRKIEPLVSSFNVACLEYYKAKGYSSLQNETIGNQASVFQHLYEDNVDDLIFKNPWDMTNGLDDADRKFLKRTLFEILRAKTDNFAFDSPDSVSFKNYALNNANNFKVPLEKGSTSTRWNNPAAHFSEFKKRAVEFCKNPSRLFKEVYEGIIDQEEAEKIDRDIENLQAYNKFRVSEHDSGRQRLFGVARKYMPNSPRSYFETNLQNLVIDYVYKDSQEYEMNRMLIRARGILMGLRLAGVTENNPEKYMKVAKHIDDYLKVSIYKRSIMQESSKKWVTWLAPLRKMVSNVYIALNPVGAVRDTIGGFMSNMIRTMTKFRTNVDSGDVLWAYQFVLGKGVHSAMSINLLDKLNAKYLISNINREQLQEGYKTDKGGVLNAGNWAYATLRKPDFLNRMTLFIARLKHDGAIDAYSVENGQLKYNWRKDKRFSLLANNDKSNLVEYNKQKGLYLSLLRDFNLEGYNLEVDVKTDLPDGYTLKQVNGIKELGDTIYGAYDTSTKSMYEFYAVGSQFLPFSTWMNGIYDVYFGKQRESSYETETVQASENGQLLYLDENGNITTEDTGIPYYRDIPIMVQGVYQTLIDTCKAIYHKPGIESLQEIWNDPMHRRNYKRVFSDLLWAMLLGLLFKYIIDPAYKEHKKNGDGEAVIKNAVVELLYKGGGSAFEEFKGPYPILDYVMNSTSPMAVKWGYKVPADVAKMLFGEKTVQDVVLNSQALPRSLSDTYKMWARDTANGITEEEA